MPAPQLFLRDYGYDGLQTPVNLLQVGLAADVKLRSLTPVLGGKVMVVTESGAHLYDLATATLVDRIRVTNRTSQTTSFAELGETWSSEACSVPIPHANMNRQSVGTSDNWTFGFLVVRRTTDLDGSQGRTYARWNIHFDPPDLSVPGPIVGEFHWLKSTALAPAEFDLQEVTFLDGCSTNAHIYRHEDGYSALSPLLGGTFEKEKSRFFDSYVIFRILIETEQQFWDWGTVDRSALTPAPAAKAAYLIFANGASRGAPDPLMKLIRMHYPGSLADVGHPIDDVSYLGGQTGARFLHTIQYIKLPQDLPLVTTKPLGGKNFLYSNLTPELFVQNIYVNKSPLGTRDDDWKKATGTTPTNELPRHGEWPEQVWQTVDQIDVARDWSREPVQDVEFPDRMNQNRFDRVEEWVPETPTGRTDALGSMGSHKFVDVQERDDDWVPGWFAGIEVDDGLWDGTALYSPTENRVLENRPGLYKQFILALRAVVSGGGGAADHRVYAEGLVGLTDPQRSSFRTPQVNINPVRGFEDPRYLYWATEADGSILVHRALIPDSTSYGPFAPARNPDGYIQAFTIATVQPGGQ